jgi:hypothetical protein
MSNEGGANRYHFNFKSIRVKLPTANKTTVVDAKEATFNHVEGNQINILQDSIHLPNTLNVVIQVDAPTLTAMCFCALAVLFSSLYV